MTVVRAPRPAARILLLDPEDRALLFRFVVGDQPPFWCTPGGAVDPGESYAEAAVRELREETGLELPCGPEVARRTVAFRTLQGVEVSADERYFLIQAPGREISIDGHTPLERAVMREWAWFDATGLEMLDEPFYPEDLAEMLRSIGAW